MAKPTPLTFTAIDLETATLEADSACSLGLAVVEDGEIVGRYSWFIRPPHLMFDEYCMAIHGITASMVSDAPSFADLWPVVNDRITGPMVAHNAVFDVNVLRKSLASCGVACPDLDYFCSRHLAEGQWPSLPSHSLDSVGAHLGLEFTHHRAEDDAYACALVVIRAAEECAVGCLAELLAQHGLGMRSLLDGGREPPSHRPQTSRRPFIGHSTRPRDLSPNTECFDQHHPFFGQVVVFTGMLLNMPRVEAWQAVIDAGGKCSESISKRVDYLVVGEQDSRLLAGHTKSSKTRRAEDMRLQGHRIRIITEKEFLSLIGR